MSVENLVAADKLTRDRALEAVANKVAENDSAEVKKLLDEVYHLEEDNKGWEVHLGKLEAASALLRAKIDFDLNECQKWNSVVVRNLDNDESRVRQAAAKLAGHLVRLAGLQLYNFFRHLAVEKLKVIVVLMQIRTIDFKIISCHVSVQLFMIRDDKEHLTETNEPKTSDVVLHDTAGWRSLESYMLLLQEIMTAFVQRGGTMSNEAKVNVTKADPVEEVGVDEELISLVRDASAHRNRFVREMSHRVIESIVSLIDINRYCRNSDDVTHTLCALIVKGLSDNWSQVRMSASSVTRTFCLSLNEANLSNFLTLLLPPMCLNRYYIAEGVRIYSQETWKRVFGDKGRQLVAENIEHVINFYISQSEAENHAVREAVCACITELVLKIDKAALQPHVSTLLDVLFLCFDDDSWPVRDSACIATGYFVEAFPSECSSVCEDILECFYENLRDNIPSVREGAATALKRFVVAYPNEYLDKVIEDTRKGLQAVKEQQPMSTMNDSLDKGPATYSVAKQLHDNDPSVHENQVMYSCGSLAPKMHKGSRQRLAARRLHSHNHSSSEDDQKNEEGTAVEGEEAPHKPKDTGGCSGHSFRRPGQPWEVTDGFVLLLGELSSEETFRKCFNESILLLLADVFKYRHFTHHMKLFTTCYKVLSAMFTNLGKMTTKRSLELFLDGLLYGLSVDNKLAQCAAQDCLLAVSKLIGPNIFRGRVENYDPRKVDLLSFILQ